MKTVLLKTTMKKMRTANYDGPVLVHVMDDADKIPFGEVMADIRKNRSPGNHRRFMGFIRQSFDMQDDFDNVTTWRKYIQMKAGHYEAVVTPKGETMYWPKTISWDELEEGDFRELFKDVTNAFIKYYGNDLNDIQINSILEY